MDLLQVNLFLGIWEFYSLLLLGNIGHEVGWDRGHSNVRKETVNTGGWDWS